MFIRSFEYDVTELQIVFEAKTLTLMAASALWLCWTFMESLAWFLRLIEAPGSLMEYSLYKPIKQCFNNTWKTFILFAVSLKRAIFTHVQYWRSRGELLGKISQLGRTAIIDAETYMDNRLIFESTAGVQRRQKRYMWKVSLLFDWIYHRWWFIWVCPIDLSVSTILLWSSFDIGKRRWRYYW